MDIFGFICCIIILFLLSVVFLLGCIAESALGSTQSNHLGRLLVFCILGYGWYLIVQNSPFTVTVTG